MKKITSLLLALLFVFTFSMSSDVLATEKLPSGSYYGKVNRIIDGDSFEFKSIDGSNMTIKIAGINTTTNPSALELTKAALQGKNVRVNILSITSANLKPYYYGVVYLNEIDLAKMYLVSGYCKVNKNTISSEYINSYTSAENEARYFRIGIWK